MLKPLAATYRTAGAFARACPLLFLVPAIPELIQHIVEYRIGMFASLKAAQAVEHDMLRLTFGSVKLLGLLIPCYWVVRYAWLRSGAEARAWSTAGIRHFLPVLSFHLAANLAALWLPVWIGGTLGPRIAIGMLALLLLINPLLAQWTARAPLGDGQPGPIRSIRTVGRIILWALPFGLIVELPPLALHYALNFLGFGKAPAALAAILIVDALVVCYLTVVIWVAQVEISRRAEAKAAR